MRGRAAGECLLSDASASENRASPIFCSWRLRSILSSSTLRSIQPRVRVCIGRREAHVRAAIGIYSFARGNLQFAVLRAIIEEEAKFGWLLFARRFEMELLLEVTVRP